MAQSSDNSAIETKLAAARTRLILDKPFLGALVLRLPMVAAKGDWCKTTATDAKTFYYNIEYIDSLSMNQTQFMLAHEALHCALSHFVRRQHRIKHRWDLACDYAINPLLVEDGLSPPPDSVIFDQYKGMTAEEIYPMLDDNDETETLDQHVYDKDESSGGQQNNAQNSEQKNDTPQQGDASSEPPDGSAGQTKPEHNEQATQSASPENTGNGMQLDSGSEGDGDNEPDPLTQQEKETLAVQWQQRMAGAAQQAMQSGKLGGSLARMIDHLLQPKLPWRMLLARYMTQTARDDFSYMRPSRREGNAILPTLKSSQVNLVVALDTSGSVKEKELQEFVSEIDALKAQIRARVSLIPCDSEINDEAPFIFESWDEIKLPKISGGGGTNFRPVFELVDQQDVIPDLLVYFTDAEGKFPQHEPPYPVIWLVKGKTDVPWGQRIQLN